MAHDNGPWRTRRPRRGPRLGLWLIFCLGLAGLVLGLARAFPDAVRTPEDWAQVAYSAGLVLLVSAIVVRSGRVLRPEHLRYAALWTAIVGLLAMIFAYREPLTAAARQLRLAPEAQEPVVITGERRA